MAKNRVTISNSTITEFVLGGSGLSARNNQVIIDNSNIINPDPDYPVFTEVYGAYAFFGTVSGNSVTISNSTADHIYGGKSDFGEVSGNSVTISNSTADYIYGGLSTYGNSKDNTVNLVSADGGFVTVNNDVYLSALSYEIGSSAINDNQGNGSLNVYGSGHKIEGNLYANNATVNFYIPAGAGGLTADGSNTMLEVKKTADVSDSKLVAHLDNVSDVPLGESSITLLKAGTLKADGLATDTAVATDGLLNVDLQVNVDNANNEITAHAYTTQNTEPAEDTVRATEDAKSPVETQISGISLINSGSDMIAGRSFGDAAAAIANSNADGNTSETGEANDTNGYGSTGSSASSMAPFASMGGSNIRQKSGSYVDTKAWNISIGFAKEVQNSKGKLLFGPIVEYGRGSYESHLDNGTVGNGDSSFWGIGGIIKQSYDDGLYLEGSARIGRMNNDYHSDDIGTGSLSYDNSATYYAMHMGAGKVVKVADRNSVDFYGKLFYTHQNGSSATLNTGHVYDFDAIDSVRTRLGCRYTFGIDDTSSLYAGLAWQHEFSGTASATIHTGAYSATAPAPSVQGDTGILELGWKTAPASKNLELALGLEAYTGKQQGIGANASILWHF
ncbi:MAG: autotransporter outer membrane beta-barrel domain-containing protein [Anaerovibrio sp.]